MTAQISTATTVRSPLFTTPTSAFGRCLHLIRASTLTQLQRQRSRPPTPAVGNYGVKNSPLGLPNSAGQASRSGQRGSVSTNPNNRYRRGAAADHTGPHTASSVDVTHGNVLLSRSDIADLTGLSPATVSRCVKKLIDAQLVAEIPLREHNSAGRPKSTLAALDGPSRFIGVYVGMKETVVLSFTATGRTVAQKRIKVSPAELDAASVIEEIIAAIYHIRAQDKHPIAAIGLASSGRLHGNSLTVPAFGWVDIPIGDMLHEHFPVPLTVAPYVAAMAAHELYSTSEILSEHLVDSTEHGRTESSATSGFTSLYVYAREQIGVAWTMNGTVHLPRSGEGDIGHLPTSFGARGSITHGVGSVSGGPGEVFPEGAEGPEGPERPEGQKQQHSQGSQGSQDPGDGKGWQEEHSGLSQQDKNAAAAGITQSSLHHDAPTTLQSVAGEGSVVAKAQVLGLPCTSARELVSLATGTTQNAQGTRVPLAQADVSVQPHCAGTRRIGKTAQARQILSDRAYALGNAITWAADLIAPDSIILAGSAFHDDPHIVPTIQSMVSRDSVAAPELRLSRSASAAPIDAARSAALDLFFHNPLGD